MRGRMMARDDRDEGVPIMNIIRPVERAPRRSPRARLAAHARHASGSLALSAMRALHGLPPDSRWQGGGMAGIKPTHPAPGMPV